MKIDRTFFEINSFVDFDSNLYKKTNYLNCIYNNYFIYINLKKMDSMLFTIFDHFRWPY